MQKASIVQRVTIFVLFVAVVSFGSVLVSKLSRGIQTAPKDGTGISAPAVNPIYKIIGTSVEGRAIESFTYSSPDEVGTAPTHVLFVGGMHGGYEWNSVLLAYETIDYLKAHPDVIPTSVSVTIIPNLNPDGVYQVIGKEGRFTLSDVPKNPPASVGTGRFNAHSVDLNRNFDCNWKPSSMWKDKKVSAGTTPFSEPETSALRDFVTAHKIAGAVFWHSQANAVYASQCNSGILPKTLEMMNAYSRATGYPAVKSFDAYAVTGDSEGWLASIGIPAITVELKTHDAIEWDKNLAGIKAVLDYFKNK